MRVLSGGASAASELELRLWHGRPIEVTTVPAWTRKTPPGVTDTVAGQAIDLPGLLDSDYEQPFGSYSGSRRSPSPSMVEA